MTIIKRKNLSLIAYAAAALLLAAGVMFIGYVARMKNDISEEVLRLHIVAEDDSTRSQLLKLCVRDRILSEFSPRFAECESAAQSEAAARACLGEIKAAAEDELVRQGAPDTVTVAVGRERFPTKAYGDISLPGGEYTALDIKIGAAKGRNWWCVMYPPLCISEGTGVLPKQSEDKLRAVLTDEEYDMITGGSSINVKFRIAEILGKYFK